MAAANGHADIAATLLDAGAVRHFVHEVHDYYGANHLFTAQDVDVRNAEGNTPLHWACLNGCVDVAKVLLGHGASPASLNRYHCLCLLLAYTPY